MPIMDDSGEKERAIELLLEQLRVEGELVGLYEKTAGEISSRPVRHLLHMLHLESRKHIDICQVALEVLRGEDVLRPEKAELAERMRRHIELEKESLDRAKKLLRNVWIDEIRGLKALIERLRDDEKEHHRALLRLAGKEFFRVGQREWVGIFQDLEERYVKYERKKE